MGNNLKPYFFLFLLSFFWHFTFSALGAIIIPMYTPKYTITNEILKNIGLVEACKEVIDNAPLVPAWEKQFQQEARERTVHYGTRIEGNELSLAEARRVLEGEDISARRRDIQEVINYRNVLKYIDELGQEGIREKQWVYTEEQLKKIHTLTCDRIIQDYECGAYRTTQVVLKNSFTDEVVFRPVPHLEVPYLVEGFFEWLNSEEGRRVHPVIRAAIANYVLVDIHPFVEGNGRTSRAFALVVLFIEGYDIKKFFSIEERFDKDAASYYGAIQAVTNQDPSLENRDLTPWIEYYTSCLAIELSRIKERVRQLSVDIKLKGKLGKQVSLSERQTKLVEYLQENGEITTPDARKVLPMISDDTILRDLKDLVKKRIIKKEGKTKAAKYLMR